MSERIIETINQIVEAKGDEYAQVLIDGINIGMVLGSVRAQGDTADNNA